MSDRGECRFNRIAGTKALLMLGGEVEECHEFLAIFSQAQRRLGLLWLIDFDEQIEGLFCILLGLSLPNVVCRGFDLWL